MTSEYRGLFTMIARANAITAEKALDTIGNVDNDTVVDPEKAIKMRDDFQALWDKLKTEEELDLNDYLKLYIGAGIAKNTIDRNIQTWQIVSDQYTKDVIPKLKKVLDSQGDDSVFNENLS